MGERPPAVRSPGKGQLTPSPRLATRAFMRRSSLKQHPPVLHPSLFRMIFLHYGAKRPIALAQVLGAVLEKMGTSLHIRAYTPAPWMQVILVNAPKHRATPTALGTPVRHAQFRSLPSPASASSLLTRVISQKLREYSAVRLGATGALKQKSSRFSTAAA